MTERYYIGVEYGAPQFSCSREAVLEFVGDNIYKVMKHDDDGEYVIDQNKIKDILCSVVNVEKSDVIINKAYQVGNHFVYIPDAKWTP